MARKPPAAFQRIVDFLAPASEDSGRRRAWGESVDDRDRDAVERAVQRLAPLFCADGPYPCEPRGMEQIPASPVLLISNHSGGVLIPDAWGLGYIWYTHFGFDRPLHGMAHEMLFKVRGTGEPMARLGALKASRSNAIAAMRDWRHDIAVMPGGDVDVFRPYTDRFKVSFGGRTGYARIALQAGVPIVPVANSGAHETLIVLKRGRRIAKALGLHKLTRSEVFPISLSIPWGLTIGPVPNVPFPARFRYRFGAPIQLEAEPAEAPTPAQIEELDRRVRAAMQDQLDQLRDETPSIQTRLTRGLRL